MKLHTPCIDQPLVVGAQTYLNKLAQGDSLQANDLDCWDEFYRRCNEVIQRYVKGHPLPASEIDDCVQDVWCNLLQRLKSWRFDPARGRFESWLYRVVHGVATDRLRSVTRGRRLKHELWLQNVAHHASPDSAVTPRSERALELRVLLHQIRHCVSPENYVLVERRWINSEPVSQVADSLGMTSAQVWFREHRMRKKLRRVLSEGRVGDGVKPAPRKLGPTRVESRVNRRLASPAPVPRGELAWLCESEIVDSRPSGP